jgi:hypothetical protein
MQWRMSAVISPARESRGQKNRDAIMYLGYVGRLYQLSAKIVGWSTDRIFTLDFHFIVRPCTGIQRRGLP